MINFSSTHIFVPSDKPFPYQIMGYKLNKNRLFDIYLMISEIIIYAMHFRFGYKMCMDILSPCIPAHVL